MIVSSVLPAIGLFIVTNSRPLITSAPGEEVTASPGSPGSAIIARGQLAPR